MEEKKFKVLFSPEAQRQIERFEVEASLQLVRDIKTHLEQLPFPIGKTRIKKPTGFTPSLYRLRSVDFRAYYRIIGREVVIPAITDKKDSEKYLKKLK